MLSPLRWSSREDESPARGGRQSTRIDHIRHLVFQQASSDAVDDRESGCRSLGLRDRDRDRDRAA
jgi:hypothetical protein